jgi:hypothetical protein
MWKCIKFHIGSFLYSTYRGKIVKTCKLQPIHNKISLGMQTTLKDQMFHQFTIILSLGSAAVVVAGARITTVESGAATKWKVVALDFSITVQSTRASKTAAGCIPKRGSKLYINPI